ncbi:MAG: phage holin family protein [Actinomycetota bacterium]|nr:phage holin family protein [Actinomycetota bacterium]
MSIPEPGAWTRKLEGAGGGSDPRSSQEPTAPAAGAAAPAGEKREGGATENLRELADVIRDVSQETTTLLRQELQLATAELAQKGKTAGIGAGMFGGAAVMGLLTAGAFTSLLILALSLLVAPWLAALIVTALYGAITAVLALTGRKKVQEATPLVPSQAIETAKSAKDKLQSAWQQGP